MGKGEQQKAKKRKANDLVATNGQAEAAVVPVASLSRKEFERALEPLQVELVKLQEWVRHTGAKICVLFEGRDAAGKGASSSA